MAAVQAGRCPRAEVVDELAQHLKTGIRLCVQPWIAERESSTDRRSKMDGSELLARSGAKATRPSAKAPIVFAQTPSAFYRTDLAISNP